MKYLQWLIYWLPLFVIGQVARIISPIACLFVIRSLKLDTVKRYGKRKVTLPRDNLVWWLSWFNTHDNSTDEWWYGMYNTTSFPFCRDWTQADYDASTVKRYFCRVMWLWRNSAYSFNYKFFSKPQETPTDYYEYGSEKVGSLWFSLVIKPSSFQLEAHHPLWRGKLNSINIGWKSHTDQERLLYAGRILGIRDVT